MRHINEREIANASLAHSVLEADQRARENEQRKQLEEEEREAFGHDGYVGPV